MLFDIVLSVVTIFHLIICLIPFSPVNHEKKMLEMIGRKLKKNSVALDVVNFGEEDEGKTEKLEALLSAVNNNDTSHIVHVPSGPNALSDVLIRLVVLFLYLPLYLLLSIFPFEMNSQLCNREVIFFKFPYCFYSILPIFLLTLIGEFELWTLMHFLLNSLNLGLLWQYSYFYW